MDPQLKLDIDYIGLLGALIWCGIWCMDCCCPPCNRSKLIHRSHRLWRSMANGFFCVCDWLNWPPFFPHWSLFPTGRLLMTKHMIVVAFDREPFKLHMLPSFIDEFNIIRDGAFQVHLYDNLAYFSIVLSFVYLSVLIGMLMMLPILLRLLWPQFLISKSGNWIHNGRHLIDSMWSPISGFHASTKKGFGVKIEQPFLFHCHFVLLMNKAN